MPGAEAVIFDLDGVLVDSEAVWDEVRQGYTEEHGGRWHEGAQRDMMGMSSVEWSQYMRDVIGVPLQPAVISAQVADRVAERLRNRLPLLPGAIEAVNALAAEWPLGLASSSNRHVIDLVLRLAGIDSRLRCDRLIRGGRRGEARAGCLPGGRAAPRRRPGAPAWRSRIRPTESARRVPPRWP